MIPRPMMTITTIKATNHPKIEHSLAALRGNWGTAVDAVAKKESHLRNDNYDLRLSFLMSVFNMNLNI